MNKKEDGYSSADHKFIETVFVEFTATELNCEFTGEKLAVKEKNQLIYCPFCAKVLKEVPVETK